MLCMYTQSSQRVSGNTETIDNKIHLIDENDSDLKKEGDEVNGGVQRSKGFQLVFKGGQARWNEF